MTRGWTWGCVHGGDLSTLKGCSGSLVDSPTITPSQLVVSDRRAWINSAVDNIDPWDFRVALGLRGSVVRLDVSPRIDVAVAPPASHQPDAALRLRLTLATTLTTIQMVALPFGHFFHAERPSVSPGNGDFSTSLCDHKHPGRVTPNDEISTRRCRSSVLTFRNPTRTGGDGRRAHESFLLNRSSRGEKRRSTERWFDHKYPETRPQSSYNTSRMATVLSISSPVLARSG